MATCCATEACHSRKAAKLRFKIEDAGGGGGGCRSVLFVSTLDDGYGAVLQRGSSSVSRVAAGLSSRPRQSSGSAQGALKVVSK
eukprot:Transcript_20852.p1 GENE.Transcript_20852~~Transcript_20852.p1  ORF type:complete len:84 (+),score=8.13 Transcript_20852:169-420(+)